MTKAEKTKEFIVENTAVLFNTQGYSGTSLSDITRATGLTKGSVYGNFENKEQVALAAFEYNVNRVFEGMKNTQLFGNSALENLYALFNFHRDNWKSIDINGGCPLLNAAVESDDNLPFLKGTVKRSFALWARYIEQLIERGIQNKELKNTINPKDYAYTFIMLIEGGVLITKISNDTKHINAIIDRIHQIIKEELIN